MWRYLTSPDGLWDHVCWWIAERLPPRLARCAFTRVVAATSESPPPHFVLSWEMWSWLHRLEARDEHNVSDRSHNRAVH